LRISLSRIYLGLVGFEGMNKDFDTWNNLKKQIQERPIDFHVRPLQIWWCSLGINIGSEQDGKNENFERPVLIYKFINKDMFLILPFTSSTKEDRHHVIVEDENLHKSSVILSQIRVVSPKRLLRQVGWISERWFLLIAQRLQEYFSIPNTFEMSKPSPGGEGFSGPEGISEESIPEIENNTTTQ